MFLRGNFLTWSVDYQQFELGDFRMSDPIHVTFFREEEQEVKEPPPHSMSAVHAINGPLADDLHNDLAEAVLHRLLRHKTPVPLPMLYSLGASHYVSPTLQRAGWGRILATSRNCECLREEFGILL